MRALAEHAQVVRRTGSIISMGTWIWKEWVKRTAVFYSTIHCPSLEAENKMWRAKSLIWGGRSIFTMGKPDTPLWNDIIFTSVGSVSSSCKQRWIYKPSSLLRQQDLNQICNPRLLQKTSWSTLTLCNSVF